MTQLSREIEIPPLSWEAIIQIFADDISAAISHIDKPEAIRLAHLLIRALLEQLGVADLDVSLPKCKNFLVEGGLQTTRKKPTETVRNVKRQLKEQVRQRMSQDLDSLIARKRGGEEAALPFPWTHSFKFLGVVLDCHWHFREHLQEMKKKAIKRLHIVKRVAGTVWGMESRILAVSTHALIESIVGYGLAITGQHVNQQLGEKVDTEVMNIAARKIAGTNISARKERRDRGTLPVRMGKPKTRAGSQQ